MTSSGPNLCTTGQSSNLNVLHWTNPGNVTAEDGTLATLTGDGASSADTLDSFGFGFSIPAGATITGILVEAKLKSSDATWKTFVNLFVDASTHTTAATSKTNGATTTTLAWTSFGSSSDTWGRTWTPTEINGANFGPIIGFSATLGNTVVASIDAIRVTVYYTSPTTVTPSTLALTTSRQTPTIFQQTRVKPSSLANTITRQTPTVRLAQPVRPASLALVTARFAPTLLSITAVRPAVIALTLSGQTPTLFLLVPLKSSAILEANYADSQTFEALYATTKTLEGNYADSQTVEAF